LACSIVASASVEDVLQLARAHQEARHMVEVQDERTLRNACARETLELRGCVICFEQNYTREI